jgi:DMSO/TMAO reductase YedYZ molybdopterin-dependent catalytic subunit
MPNVHDDPKYHSGDPPGPADLADPSIVISPDTLRADRVPPGQSRTRKWPVLHYGYVPGVPLVAWRFRVTGLVRSPLELNWDDFRALPRRKVFADFHCVTQWSRLGNLWEGVFVRDLLEQAGVLPEARFAIVHGYDSGWTTNLPLADLLQDDVLLADTHDGEPLSADHGGPVRLMVPRLYAWKSAKWARAIELVAEDRPGYWEQGGYHMRGDPWLEERHGG